LIRALVQKRVGAPIRLLIAAVVAALALPAYAGGLRRDGFSCAARVPLLRRAASLLHTEAVLVLRTAE